MVNLYWQILFMDPPFIVLVSRGCELLQLLEMFFVLMSHFYGRDSMSGVTKPRETYPLDHTSTHTYRVTIDTK